MEPMPIPTISPEYQAAIDNYNKHTIGLAELVAAQQGDIKKFGKAVELNITLPLSWFLPNAVGKGGVVFADKTQTKPEDPIRQDKVPKNINEARKKLRRGQINTREFETALNTEGSNNPAFWTPARDARPGTEGNNKSRTGFKYDIYHHIKGQVYQHVVKGAIRSAINMAHNDWLKKYDKNAFVYDDPMLIDLDIFLKTFLDQNINEKADKPYHFNMMFKVIDLGLGTCKEDIFYRVLLKNCINTYCEETVYPMTQDEQEHFDRWCKP